MRILQYAFFSLLFLALTVFVLFIIAQEILMFWGSSSVQSTMYSFNKNPSANVCQEYLNEYSGDRLRVAYQIRFLSNTEYIAEATCSPFNSNASQLSEHTLPPFVSKIPGSSGLIWESQQSSLGLTVFSDVYSFIKERMGLDLSFLAKKKYLSVQEKTVVTASEVDTFGEIPIAACEGYGYQCCDSISHIGAGTQLSNTTNCEKSCFSTCIRRPIILSFMSDPFPDLERRELITYVGGSVIFQYLVDTNGVANQSIVVDFGDGQQSTSLDSNGSAQHAYACNQARCEYIATISVTDVNGLTSAQTPLSMLRVIVTQ